MLTKAFLVAILAFAVALPNLAQPTFRVTIRPEAAEGGTSFSGRLVVYILSDNNALGYNPLPADGPFFTDPQPMVGLDMTDLEPLEQRFVTDETADAIFHPRFEDASLADLAPGRYTAQAVLDTQRTNSRWEKEPGNLFSNPVPFTITADADANPVPTTVDLRLENRTRRPVFRPAPGLEFLEIPSPRLTRFRETPVSFNIGVVYPANYDPERQYPAVYQVPGFGGDHTGAARVAERVRTRNLPPDDLALHTNAFWFVLDPEGPNGHHLFLNSPNNGPVGDALITEVVPALERRFNLIPDPTARLLRGHSSGGWSTLHLATTYPDTFGATWSTGPDPVDFSYFQKVDLYNDGNFYERAGEDHPSYTDRFGKVTMTIRQENQMEEVLGPDNTSAQQWDSWFAAFGSKNAAGHPAALFHPVTGDIDKPEAQSYKPSDLHQRLLRDRATLGRVYLSRVRLLVGSEDNFDLDNAVRALRETIDTLDFYTLPEGPSGSIQIIPGEDHSTILATPEARAIPANMLDHLRRYKHIK